MNKFVKNVALYVLLIIIAVSIFNTFVHPQEKHSEITYSDFISQVEKKNVDSVTMTNNSISGKLKDGSGQYLWQPGLKEGQPDKLLSYRLVTSAYMPEVASGAKPVLFGDFSSYWIADRQGRSFQRLNELYAATGQIGFRATQRVDGRLVQSEGLKCLAMKA